MKADSEYRAKTISASISKVRDQHKNYPSGFSLEQLAKDLKSDGCPYASFMPGILKRAGLVAKNGKYYFFVSPEPIHFKGFKTYVDDLADAMRLAGQNSRSGDKKSKNSLPVLVEAAMAITEHKLTCQEMIDILKSQGYKIFAPITEFKEV